MITIEWDWLYGMALGMMIADNNSCEEDKIDWGVVFFLGIVAIVISKEKAD